MRWGAAIVSIYSALFFLLATALPHVLLRLHDNYASSGDERGATVVRFSHGSSAWNVSGGFSEAAPEMSRGVGVDLQLTSLTVWLKQINVNISNEDTGYGDFLGYTYLGILR